MSPRGFSSKQGWGLTVVVAVVLAVLVLPASASAADGGISGSVTFAPGGAQVAGAEVCAEGEGEAGFACTSSEADGDYEISGLAPGNYVVTFGASESSPYVVFKRYPAAVAVTSEAITPGIDAAVSKGGAIEGTVTDKASGLPLANVEVCSIWEEGNEFDACDYTGSSGTFKLIGVHPGPHEIEFWSFEGGYESRFVNVTVSSGSTLSVSAALVRFQGRISGHVYTAATHAPLAGVAVCAIWAKTGETGGCALTSSAGAYTFFPVYPGGWKIAFSPEPAEVEFAERAKSDSWPTQFWNSKPTLAAAEVLDVTATSVFTGIDGLLGPGPALLAPSAVNPPPVTTSPATTPVKKKKKPLTCRRGFVKKRVKGKSRCVRRRFHHKHHRHHRDV